MQKTFLQIISFIVLISLTSACSDEKSLQQFIITQQEKQDIISFDLSPSLLTGIEKLQNEDEDEVLKSIRKINILAHQLKDTDISSYNTEKQTINAIFKQKKYNELIRYGKGSKGAKIFLVGEDNQVDELIIFANDNEFGWLLVRILGKNIQPEKIMQLFKNLNFNKDDFDFSQFKDILNKKN